MKNVKKPFKLAASPKKDTQVIRDKDNTAPRPPPPRAVREPAPNLAPGGALGIRRGLPTQKPPEPKHSFIKGDASKTFKSIVPPSKDNDRDIDR